MTKAKEWKLVKVYECPDSGQLVRDMDDAGNHKCARVKVAEETIAKLELLKLISDRNRKLKSTAWYKLSERRDIRFKIWELDAKRLYK